MNSRGFRIHNAVNGVATIDIYSDIDPWWGVSGASFRQELEQVTASHLEVHINSGGGDVHEGLAIMNSLRDHSAEVTVIVDGIAASAASFIAVGSGGRLVMHESSTLMIHDAWTFAGGDAASLEKAAGVLDKLSDLIAGVYAAKSGTPVEEWREAMREEAWFTAEEAVFVGLADEVRSSTVEPEPVAAGMRSRILNSGAFKYTGRAQAPTPAILNRRGKSSSANTPSGEKGETMGFLNDVAARLGLADADLTEGKVLAALNEVLAEQAEERAGSEADATVAAADAAADANSDGPGDEDEDGEEDSPDHHVTDDDDELTTTIDKAKLAELEADAELGRQLREEKERDAANEAIEAAVNDGRLGAKARAKWTARYLADPQGTASLLDTLPKGRVNRQETGHAHSPDDTDDDQHLALSAAFGLTH